MENSSIFIYIVKIVLKNQATEIGENMTYDIFCGGYKRMLRANWQLTCQKMQNANQIQDPGQLEISPYV